MFSHEEIVIRAGQRTGLPIIIAIHSTAPGRSGGGCRVNHYADWRDGLSDALRLSQAMTYKCAIAGLDTGGGKTVVALPIGHVFTPDSRRDLLHDVGDVIDSLQGRYVTGPDVGTGPADMAVIKERTPHVVCTPVEMGGCGDSSPATAAGVMSALHAVCARLGDGGLKGRRVGLLGLGHVGSHLARHLAEEGAWILAADVDPGKRALAEDVGASWTGPDELLGAELDILVPAALGGLLTEELVPRLRCAAIAGPANNQIATPEVAQMLHDRGVLWAPDDIVSAGGAIYAHAVELRRQTPEQADALVAGIGDRLGRVLDRAGRDGVSPYFTAQELVRERLRDR
ncbi:Glu/Leu/Phe/Val dehydrogenase dimerization domain-containing protein [Nonomuraea typhae]|uniref:Glu/Leu/Phe/Val dehydrogenase dimerization domain-containing protein n=1 Tax=Nonomuraea typhae TaxID=2603600 RepID=UPI0012FCA4D6|nr:Glu/Leu/Phe/Val dehydrogenase dimerization domain-containing protein [Nonomuraea typhae]